MSKRFSRPVPDHLQEPSPIDHARDTGVLGLYVIAMGIVVAIGLVGGSLWIVWRVLSTHFAR